MALRYWVIETIQTFNVQNVRVCRRETTTTFDSLVDAAEQISMLQAQPPAAVAGMRCTQRIVLEGQQLDAVIPSAGRGSLLREATKAPCYRAVPYQTDLYKPRGFA